MQSGDKRLKGKEMSVPDSNNMGQIQCAEGDSGGEEREKEAEAGLRVGGRGIGNAVELAAAEIKGVGLSAVERAGTSAAEDGELVAGLVDGTITIDALRNGESRTAGMRGGDKFGSGARAKAGEMGRVVPRGEDLENAEAVLAVGDEADFYIVDVIELAFSGENLIERGRVGLFDINDRESLLPCRDVSVSAGNVDVAGIFEGDERVGDELWLGEIRNLENFQAVAIDDEGISELYGDAAGITESGRADVGGNARGERIVEVDHDEGFVREDISEGASDGDAARAREYAVRVERETALQEIVGGIAVEERANTGTFRFQVGIADDDEAFFFVSDVEVAVEEVNGLLFVFRQLLAQRIDGERGR